MKNNALIFCLGLAVQIHTVIATLGYAFAIAFAALGEQQNAMGCAFMSLVAIIMTAAAKAWKENAQVGQNVHNL
jgi:hypothetical protein